MSDPYTFKGILAPTGVPISTASDTRSFCVDIEADDAWDEIQTAVEAQLVDEGVVNAWALSNHWDIACLLDVDEDPPQQLRDALRSSRPDVHQQDGITETTVHLRDSRTAQWETTRVALEDDVYAEFQTWKASSDIVSISPTCDIHDAVLRGVVMAKPRLPQRFFLDPLAAQSDLFVAAVSHNHVVENQLSDFTI